MKTRIYILDDQQVFIDGIMHLFRNDPDIEVTGFTTDASIFLKNYDCSKFDILLVDYKMPEINGIQLIKKLEDEINYLKIIMVSVYHDINVLQDAIGAGAKGYIVKNSSAKEFKNAFKKVMNGESYYKIH